MLCPPRRSRVVFAPRVLLQNLIPTPALVLSHILPYDIVYSAGVTLIKEHNPVQARTARMSSSVTNLPFSPSANSKSDPAKPLMRTLSPVLTALHSGPAPTILPVTEDPGPLFSVDAVRRMPPAEVVSTLSAMTRMRLPVGLRSEGLRPARATTAARRVETTLRALRACLGRGKDGVGGSSVEAHR